MLTRAPALRWAAAAAILSAAAAQSPWYCPEQPGPFPIWTNEWDVVAKPLSAATRRVEIAAVAKAGVDYRLIDLLVLDRSANVLTRRNLASTCVLAPSGPGGGVRSLDIFTCSGFSDTLIPAALGGGFAIVNNRGTAILADDVVIQYLTMGNFNAPLLSVPPCVFPPDELERLDAPAGTSVQLINGRGPASLDASTGAVDIYGWFWEAGLPSTFGAPNSGVIPGGGFDQTLKPGALPPPKGLNVAGADAVVDPVLLRPLGTELLGEAPQVDPAGGMPSDALALPGSATCPLGPLTTWSPCSLHCAGGASGEPAVSGWQIAYQPVLINAANAGAVDVTTCPSLAQRSTSRACVTRAQADSLPSATVAAVPCTTCTNGRLDAGESDVDCGGGPEDPAHAGWSVQQYAAWLQVPDAAASAQAAIDANVAAGSICPRCLHGRRCATHGDCAPGQGLLCLQSTCQPWAFAAGASFADAPLAMRGLELLDLHAGSAPARAAHAAFLTAVAEVINGASATAHFPPLETAAHVSATVWQAARGGPVNDVDNEPVWQLVLPSTTGAAGGRRVLLAPGDARASVAMPSVGDAAGAFAADAAASGVWSFDALGNVEAGLAQQLQLQLQQQGGRRLANSGDTLTTTLRLMASSPEHAVAVAAALNSGTPVLSLILQERLRAYAPTIGGVALAGAPAVQANPYNVSAANPGPSTNDNKATDVGGGGGTAALSGGAIAGVLVGALAAGALVAAAALLVAKRRRDGSDGGAQPPRRRAGINIGEMSAAAGADGGAAGLAAGGLAAGQHHIRAAFAPAAISSRPAPQAGGSAGSPGADAPAAATAPTAGPHVMSGASTAAGAPAQNVGTAQAVAAGGVRLRLSAASAARAGAAGPGAEASGDAQQASAQASARSASSGAAAGPLPAAGLAITPGVLATRNERVITVTPATASAAAAAGGATAAAPAAGRPAAATPGSDSV